MKINKLLYHRLAKFASGASSPRRALHERPAPRSSSGSSGPSAPPPRARLATRTSGPRCRPAARDSSAWAQWWVRQRACLATLQSNQGDLQLQGAHWETLRFILPLYQSHYHTVQIGNGRNTLFWLDVMSGAVTAHWRKRSPFYSVTALSGMAHCPKCCCHKQSSFVSRLLCQSFRPFVPSWTTALTRAYHPSAFGRAKLHHVGYSLKRRIQCRSNLFKL